MNKIGNIDLVGLLKLGDSEYTVDQLLQKLQNSIEGGSVSIQHVTALPTGSNINYSTIYVYNNTLNVYDGTNWISTGGGSQTVDYNNLINKPTIPTKLSELTNDLNVEQNVITTIKVNNTPLSISNRSVNIDLSTKANIGDIPTKVSQLLNDSQYITANGNIATATKLATARTITLSGAITGSANFDGSSNITINTTLNGIEINPEGFSISWDNITNKPTIPTNSSFTLAGLSEKSYNSLTNKPTIPTNSSFTLAGLSEKSYNSLTDKPSIPSKYSDLTNDTGKVLSDVNFSSSLNTKLTGIENGAQVNKIETIKVNGTAATITNKTIDIDTTSIEYLLFKTPNLKQSQFVHFRIEFSNDYTFPISSTVVLDTSDSDTYTLNGDNQTISGIKIFTGLQLVDFPANGIGYQFSNEPMQLSLSSYKNYQYYRFQWLVGRVGEVNGDLATGPYGYGQIAALLSIHDFGGIEARLTNIETILGIDDIEDDINSALSEVE